MADCDFLIKANIAEDCDNPMVQGAKAIGYIGNFDDLDKETITKTGNKISTLALVGTAKLYKIYQSGKTPFTGSQTELAEGTYRNKFNKTAHFVVLENGATITSGIIDKLANGKFFVILENNFAGTSGDNTFEIVGFEQGLVASALTHEKYNDETGGGWDCTMVENNAPTSGIFILGTSVSATRTALEGLC